MPYSKQLLAVIYASSILVFPSYSWAKEAGKIEIFKREEENMHWSSEVFVNSISPL